jgi:hypothetical protein
MRRIRRKIRAFVKDARSDRRGPGVAEKASQRVKGATMTRFFRFLAVASILSSVALLPARSVASALPVDPVGAAGRPTISGSSAPCELVEIYPGYPGYRGLVTGVAGPGDAACLADLNLQDPSFSKDEQDRANLDAAHRLGVGGSPNVWTWETWMAIEVERGLVPHCYSCLFSNGALSRIRVADVAADDPRLELGGYRTRRIANAFAADLGLSTSQVTDAPTDDELRAIAGMENPGRYLTATEVLDAAARFLADSFCGNGVRCGTPVIERLLTNLLGQGGYWPMPPGATDDDQVFLVTEAIHAVADQHMDPLSAEGLVDQYLMLAGRWRALGPAKPPFGEWLRAQHG